MIPKTLFRRLSPAATRPSPRCFASLPISRDSLAPSSPSASAHQSTAASGVRADGAGCIFRDPIIGSSQTRVATAPTLLQPGVIIYDGVCHLCHRGVKWIIKVDKYAKLKFCCLQSKAAEPYLQLCGVDREDVRRRFLFIEGPGAYYEGSTAALRVASHLPLPYSALSTLLVLPAPLRDAVYDYVAKRRYDWFGKEDECIIKKQDHELLGRFIDREELFGGGGDDFSL